VASSEQQIRGELEAIEATSDRALWQFVELVSYVRESGFGSLGDYEQFPGISKLIATAEDAIADLDPPFETTHLSFCDGILAGMIIQLRTSQ
jgi:hypothetical protein